jgi:hypothetical protein
VEMPITWRKGAPPAGQIAIRGTALSCALSGSRFY